MDLSETVQTVENQLKKLKLNIIDIKYWEKKKDNGYDVIIVGVLPNKAAIFKVVINWFQGRSYFLFAINGRMDHRRKIKFGKHKFRLNSQRAFQNIYRHSVGHESYGSDFYINTQPKFMTSDLDFSNTRYISIEDQLMEGINFYKHFIKLRSKYLSRRFYEYTHLWFVAEHCDEAERLKAKF